MDFTLTENQSAVRELAGGVFGRLGDPLRLPEIEAGQDSFDAELWEDLASAGVLGLLVPEEHGGAGLGLPDLAMALIEQGRTLGRVPLWETAAAGVLALVRYGTADQQSAWLPGVSDGSVVLTVSLEEPGMTKPWRPAFSASGNDDGWALTGTGTAVSAGHLADAIIVPAATDLGVELFLVPTNASGVSRTRYRRTDRGISVDLELRGAAAQRLSAGPAEDRHDWLLRQAWLALSAVQLGVAQQAVRQTAAYTSERHQFGVPLATFQAIAHQLADRHIDTEAMEVTLLNALWRQETGRECATAIHVARWWASDAADRVARTAQHLHGGLGADITYPSHRYLLWTTTLSNTLGSASWHLGQLAELVADGADLGGAAEAAA